MNTPNLSGIIFVVDHTVDEGLSFPQELIALMRAGFYVDLRDIWDESRAERANLAAPGQFLAGVTWRNVAGQGVGIHLFENNTVIVVPMELADLTRGIFGRQEDYKFERRM